MFAGTRLDHHDGVVEPRADCDGKRHQRQVMIENPAAHIARACAGQ